MTDELHYLSLVDAGKKIAGGEISSAELTAAMLARIEKLNGSLHAYVTVLGESAKGTFDDFGLSASGPLAASSA